MSKQRELPTASLSLHPDAGIIPEMPADQYERFLADVKDRGILKPIELEPGTKTVLEGRTRLRAAVDAKLPSVPVVDADLRGKTPLEYMISAEVHRRHLTHDQLAALAVELEPGIAKAAKERQREGGKTAGRGRPKKVVPDPAQPKIKPAPKSRQVVAAITGAKPGAVSDAKKLKKVDPERFEQVKAGTVTLAAAKKAAGIATKSKPKAEPPAQSAPKPFGSYLNQIPNFPLEAVSPLADKGIFTVEDLDARVAEIRKQRGQKEATRYSALKETLDLQLALKVGDCLVDHFKLAEPATNGKTAKKEQSNGAAGPGITSIGYMEPCPFCGSKKIVSRAIIGNMRAFACEECNSRGPDAAEPSVARARWNKRAKE